MEPTPAAPLVSAAARGVLVPGAALLRAAPRMSRRRATLLIAAFLATWVVLQVLFALPLWFLVGALTGSAPLLFSEAAGATISLTAVGGFALAAGQALGVVGAAFAFQRSAGLTLRNLGLRPEATWARELVVGAALGPAVFALVLTIELALGWADVGRGTLDAGGLLLGVLSFIAVALNEELAIRGLVLQLLGRAWSPRAALVLSSIIFAALHAANPHVTPLAVAFLIVAGLALAWGYFATGRLWLPLAFHWSWNVAQGVLFGFPVSGIDSDSVLTVTVAGPDWATGGAFGPEAGLVGLLAEAVAATLILAWRRAGGSAAATAAVAAAGLAGLAWLVVLAR